MRFLLPTWWHCCFQQNNPLATRSKDKAKSEISQRFLFALQFVEELPAGWMPVLPAGWKDCVPGGWLLLPGEGPVFVQV